MKNSKGFIQIIIILVVLALIGGAYYFGTKNKTVPAPTVSIQPSSSPVASFTPDPTANWKTVSNQFWIFKIPQNWHYIKCSEANSIYGGPEISDDKTVNVDQCEGGGFPTMSIDRNMGKFSIPVSIGQNKTDPNAYYLTVTNKKNIQIGGENAIMQNERMYNIGSTLVDTIAVYIQKNGYTDSIKVFDTSSENPNTPPFSDTTNIFNQILSAFKFTK